MSVEPRVANRWTPQAAALLAGVVLPATKHFSAVDIAPVISGMTLWDIWPVQLDNGDVATVAGGELWVTLSAPRGDDPNERHNLARMRLLHRIGGDWRDCGDLLPDGFSPGSREWSGSTRLEPESGRITLWFTATGRRGDSAADFEQRLFHATGTLDLTGALPKVRGWQKLTQSVNNDGTYYADLSVNQGIAGRIKGFRDPYWFRDPADGRGYLLFTGSKSADTSLSDHDGVIGIASAGDTDGLGPFALLPPLIDADGLVNELERPHVFIHAGRYYLFWSSQQQVFAPGGIEGPTGLYGMVAPALFGPYEPLNGSGLVLANPADEPRQAYAWQVLPTLEVVSFVDYWSADPATTPEFQGTIAPFARIALDGATSRIVA